MKIILNSFIAFLFTYIVNTINSHQIILQSNSMKHAFSTRQPCVR